MVEKKSVAKAAPKAAPKSTAKAGKPVAIVSAPAVIAAQAAKAAPAVAPRTVAKSGLEAGERQRLIAEAAYYRAEKRGFAPGDTIADWLEAEREVSAKYPH